MVMENQEMVMEKYFVKSGGTLYRNLILPCSQENMGFDLRQITIKEFIFPRMHLGEVPYKHTKRSPRYLGRSRLILNQSDLSSLFLI